MKAVLPLSLLFVIAGALHFSAPAIFISIVPPYLPSFLPDAKALVMLSGVAEIAGAIGLLIPATRAAAGIGLIALLVAVFPANVYMWQQAIASGKSTAYDIVLLLRLPLQPLLVWWVLRAAVTTRRTTPPTARVTTR